MAPPSCPHCGARLSRNAKACPECGSDDQTGWADDAQGPDLGLPDEEFDYGDFVQREFGARKSPVPPGLAWFWWLVAVALIAAFLWYFLRQFNR